MAAISTIAAVVGASAAAKGAVDARKAGKAQERAATQQADENRKAAESAAKANQESAAQAARQQEQAAARAAAQAKAAEDTKPVDDAPDVKLVDPEDEKGTSAARKRRQSFGIGSAATGVNI